VARSRPKPSTIAANVNAGQSLATAMAKPSTLGSTKRRRHVWHIRTYPQLASVTPKMAGDSKPTWFA
jgi:hypothetical protein